jgi:hypothetical protein
MGYKSILKICPALTRFEVCQAKGFQDIEWSVYSYVQFDSDLSSSKSLEFTYYYLSMHQFVKFEVCQANGFQDIERIIYSYFQC